MPTESAPTDSFEHFAHERMTRVSEHVEERFQAGQNFLLDQFAAGTPVLPSPSDKEVARKLKRRGIQFGQAHPDHPEMAYVTLPEGVVMQRLDVRGMVTLLNHRQQTIAIALCAERPLNDEMKGWVQAPYLSRPSLMCLLGVIFGSLIGRIWEIYYGAPIGQSVLVWLITVVFALLCFWLWEKRRMVKTAIKTVGRKAARLFKK